MTMTYYRRPFESNSRFPLVCSEHQEPYPTDLASVCNESTRGRMRQSKLGRKIPWADRWIEHAAVSCVQLVAFGELGDKQKGEQAVSRGSEAIHWSLPTWWLPKFHDETESLHAAQTDCQLGWYWSRPVQHQTPMTDIRNETLCTRFWWNLQWPPGWYGRPILECSVRCIDREVLIRQRWGPKPR